MTLKAVLFDLDDTLLWDDRSVQEAFKATCAEAAKHVAVNPEELEASVRKEARSLYESFETFEFTKMIGINPFEGLWANFTQGENENFRKLEKLAPGYRTESWTRGLAALGIEDRELGYKLGELFPAERRRRPYVYEETFRVLDALKGSYQLLLLTNGSPDLQKEKLAGVPNIAPYFDHIVISGEFGVGKPAKSIFNHALGLLGIEAEEGIMIGDKLTTDILGSGSVGMRNIWINHHGLQSGDEIVPAYEVSRLQDILTIITNG
ncbi:HAD family hydrolase [Paenibacillus alginolyticus]|uniref:Phosphoserine phosphatase n=1 Tax=Paenibacillus alginolyticus TaxID=59839 RepID=A0ABT4GFT1_9BACL|nr:HAD family hydrolase [Paenibacillus alginolyticus]MCY9664220.1 HAD family hydrolase [Paenibacillus alginolyticus]MCY9695047.1 HAD family hydrolase [Paenibacillus alginolyticus]MEC0145459.1 HAD family hydrolase [Paenibacillus alginolyticus]